MANPLTRNGGDIVAIRLTDGGRLMPSPPVLEVRDVHVWRFTLDSAPLGPGVAEALLAPDERARADRFRFAELRDRFAAARAQLRTVLGVYAGRPADRLRFGAGAAGKPFLEGGGPRFNLSHSGGFAILAVAAAREVGADLEAIRPLDDLDRLAEATLGPGERAALARLPEERRLDAFFAAWTRKEAVMKLAGLGLALEPASLEVTLAPGLAPALLAAPEALAGLGPVTLAEVAAPPGHRAAVAVAGDAPRLWHFALC